MGGDLRQHLGRRRIELRHAGLTTRDPYGDAIGPHPATAVDSRRHLAGRGVHPDELVDRRIDLDPDPAAGRLRAPRRAPPPRSVLGGPDGEAVAVASSGGLGATGLDAAGACPTLQADSGSAMPNVVPREADMRVILPVERGVMGARGSLSCLGRTPLP